MTGDAIFAQRPLAQEQLKHHCDYLVQIKGNQPDIHDAAQQAFATAAERRPLATTVDKKKANKTAAASGPRSTTPITFARHYTSPDAKFSCVLIGT